MRENCPALLHLGVDDTVYVWLRLRAYVVSAWAEEGLYVALPLAVLGLAGPLLRLQTGPSPSSANLALLSRQLLPLITYD